MAKIQLPPGCRGFDMKDGTRVTAAREGGTVTVDDRHASANAKSQFAGDGNLLTATGAVTLGTKKGKKCPSCSRLWNNWTTVCHSCGTETECA